jgi:hypothetical protein
MIAPGGKGMKQIVPPQRLSSGSRFGSLSVFGVGLLLIGVVIPATRGVAVALLVTGLIGYVFYIFYLSRHDPSALEKDVKGPDDQVLH